DILSSIRQIIADEDAPAAEAEQANDQSAVDDAFDSIDVSGDEEMSTDDVDALFDDVPAATDDDLGFDSIGDDDFASIDDDDDEDVLELAAPAAVEEPEIESAASDDDLGFDAIEDTVEVNAVAEPAPPAPSLAEEVPLISENVAASVKSSFGALHNGMGVSSSTTIEGLMSAMLRPMLKEWLDENLPETVERLVREEIQRIQGQ
ncbi:MAG: DUF2497 domain-containing protein, partial [Hyphomicrobiales bacterium]